LFECADGITFIPMENAIGYEIRDASNEDGLRFELLIEGMRVATAAASAAMVHDLQTDLGFSRDQVIAQLKTSLKDALRSQQQSVEITDIREREGEELRFVGRFRHRLAGEIASGVVWYDVPASETGPDNLPAVVRNKMRFEVHRMLTSEGSVARALVDLQKGNV
jgi:hypothetical protein